MTKSFNHLRQSMSPEAIKMAAKKTQQMLKNTPLKELRQAKHISQTELAALLSTKQANISRIERRADIHISTLRRYIEVMGE